MDGLRSKLVAFAKSFVVPIRTDQLEPLPAIQWTWWRKVLLVVMLVAAGWFLWRILFSSISWLLYIVQHDDSVVLTETPRQEEMMSWLTNWGLIIAWRCLPVWAPSAASRRMRSLPAIVAGHALWDLMLLAPRWSVGALFAVVVYIGFRLDSEPRRTKQVQTA